MVGLTSTQLPPDSLHAGDTIAYYTRMYVAGDHRGYREAVILRVDATPGLEHPIKVTTDELIQLTQMIVRVSDSDGTRVNGKWRMLRTFSLVSGMFDPQSDRSLLCDKVNGIINAVFAGQRNIGRAIRDQIDATPCSLNALGIAKRASPPHTSISSDVKITRDVVALNGANDGEEYEGRDLAPISMASAMNLTSSQFMDDNKRSSTHLNRTVAHAQQPTDSVTVGQASGSEDFGNRPSTCAKEVFELSSGSDIVYPRCEEEEPEGRSESDTPALCTAPPPNALLSEGAGLLDVSAVAEYLNTVPTRLERSNIRHQVKKRASTWHVPRSRKKRHQKKCAVTRSGSSIHHAHSVKAKKMKELLRMPGMRAKLNAVRSYRPVFVEPTPPPPSNVTQINVYETYVMEEVAWPDWVEPITESIEPVGLTFDDIGDGDACVCHGDCFADTCNNAKMAIYCTPDCCRLDAKCSNAPCTHPGLKLYNTHRLGLGGYTTQALFAGEIIAEYNGALCEYEALYEGQPEKAKKQNSGYTMLLNEKSKRGKFVYVEALKCGSIARFFQHACTPNVEFFEMKKQVQREGGRSDDRESRCGRAARRPLWRRNLVQVCLRFLLE